ncbi:Pr6Pr family membrane protein [Gracilibacillus sp. S3-1-1]|uniref:Pr6Pr family membrane protein n=1 Tax=Gracilibacillus pellucidus TaxID=3095368 RepID=A0ACC6M8H6_9BACI|nr:Pr6Pr family membrane protein [Gracilibacillus sp. S3-1-1]MDX8047198.1 Pr6Pr family membrane protein [Gracilibacillus sp. S3-1-1]
MMKLKLVFHILISLISFVSVILHICYSPEPLISTTKFTIHSNLLVAITFFISSFTILTRKNLNPVLDYLKNCSIIYMAVTLLTYHFFLSSGGEYAGIRIVTNLTLHYVIPICIFINWIMFETKKNYRYMFILYWILYPVLYSVVSLFRGLFDGFYPYFFLNPHGEIPFGVGSYSNVVLSIIVFSFVYVILGFLLILLNKLFLYIRNKNNPPSNQDMGETKVL